MFNWTGVSPTGQFQGVPDPDWDVSQLYTSGQVKFIGNALYCSGSGTWDNSTTTNWAVTSGGSQIQTWAAGKDAAFGGTPGTVNVAETIASVNSLTFMSDGYTLSGTGTVTMTGARGKITTGAGTDTINCIIDGSAGLTKIGPGTLVLGAANTFTGLTQVTGGTLQLAHSNALQNSTLDYNNYGGSLSFGSLTNATFGGLQGDQNLALTSTGGNVALTVGCNNASTTYSGQLSGDGSLTKSGTGRLVLSGPNSYTGVTNVQSGALQINNASTTTNVLTNTGGVNVTGGFLVLDYSASGTSVASTVQRLLQTAYNNGTNSFQSGQIYDTAATSSIGLGWVDNTTAHQITIMPALYGDATLDGVVGPADLSKLLTNYGKTGMTWSQGDFTYDGTIGPADLSKLLTNYGKNGPLNIGNIPAIAYDELTSNAQAMQMLASRGVSISEAVPEPSSFVMLASLATAALGMAAYGWRRRRN